MLSIQVSQDQLEYVGLFAAPAFQLLARPEHVVSGLYHAFHGLHGGLSDFHVESDSQVPLADTIAVNLTGRGTYRFASERIEWTFAETGQSELDASVLDLADAWLRRALPTVRYQAHYYTYYAHVWVLDGSAREFLLGLGSPQLEGVGVSQGTGLIFHTTFPEHSWSIQLTIDHSNVVPDGLYLQVVATVSVDQVKHGETVEYIDKIFRDSLQRLGLQLERFVG